MRRILQISVLSSAGFLVVGLARLVALVCMGREFSPAAYSTFSAAIGLSVFASLVFHVPLGTLFDRTYAGFGHGGWYTRWAVIGTPVVVAAVVAVGVLILRLPPQATLVAAGLTASYCLYIYCRYAVLALGRPLFGLLGELGVGVSLVAAGILAISGQQTPSLVVFVLSFGVYVVIVAPLLLRRSASPETGVAERGSEPVALLHVALSVLSTNGPLQLLLILLTSTSSVVQGALAAAAFTLATPMSMFGQAVTPVLVSNAAALHRERRRAKILAPVVVLSAVSIVASAGVALLAPVLLGLFYGPEFADATATLQILAVAMGFFNLGLIASSVLLGWGKNSFVVVSQAVGGAIFLATALVWQYLAPGPNVIAIAYAIGTGVAVAAMGVLVVTQAARVGQLDQQ